MMSSTCPLLAPIHRIGERWVVALSEENTIEGFRVYTEIGAKDSERVLEAIKGGLDLIARVDPVRFSLVRRYVDRILVGNTRRLQYWPVSQVSVLGTEYVITSPPAYVANALIFHAVEGRLGRAGLSSDASLRARAESLVARTQIAFAQRLPPEELNASDLFEFLTGRLNEIAGGRRTGSP